MGKNTETNLKEIGCDSLELIVLAQNTPAVQGMTCEIGNEASIVVKTENCLNS
jgi:hypothetical protein